MLRIFSFPLLVGLGYYPSVFVHTNAVTVPNSNKYDCNFSDKNSTALPLCCFFVTYFLLLRLKIKLLKRIIFSVIKNKTKIISVSTGFLGASVAKSIIGKPNAIAGKFW